jgi:outer membrane protein OmpA-like peptidoglycan-associated protein
MDAGVAETEPANASAPVRTPPEPGREGGPGEQRAVDVAQTVKTEVAYARVDASESVERGPRWAVILPVLALAALFIWGVSSFSGSLAPSVGVTAPQAPVVPTPRALMQGTAPATAETLPAGAVVLPGGKTLDLSASSAEAAMAHALADPTLPLPATFDLENLTFDDASSAITARSTKTIDDLAAMLLAYPSARIRIEGHADGKGSPATNRALFEARATSLKNPLVAKGIAGERIETQGVAARPLPRAPTETRHLRAELVRAELVLLER